MHSKISILTFLLSFFFLFKVEGQEHNLNSPNSHLKISANFSNETCFNIAYKGQEVIEKVCIDLTLSDGRAFGSAAGLYGIGAGGTYTFSGVDSESPEHPVCN